MKKLVVKKGKKREKNFCKHKYISSENSYYQIEEMKKVVKIRTHNQN